eukprot:SAG11_NODE_40_length_21525_cov_16.276066_9_plen_257_part_00
MTSIAYESIAYARIASSARQAASRAAAGVSVLSVLLTAGRTVVVGGSVNINEMANPFLEAFRRAAPATHELPNSRKEHAPWSAAAAVAEARSSRSTVADGWGEPHQLLKLQGKPSTEPAWGWAATRSISNAKHPVRCHSEPGQIRKRDTSRSRTGMNEAKTNIQTSDMGRDMTKSSDPSKTKSTPKSSVPADGIISSDPSGCHSPTREIPTPVGAGSGTVVSFDSDNGCGVLLDTSATLPRRLRFRAANCEAGYRA